MADVTARLAEGMPAVANAGAYVTACCRLGFSGLTSDTIADWYGTEEGLDLAALQADSDALSAAATAADDAARQQADLTSRLAGAWHGSAGAAAQGFLLGQAAAAESIRDALRTAAIATSTLHDDLAGAVDAKVDAALNIDDRVAGRRAEWLDAAGTVQTGAGDVVSASELVDAQVKPFVADDIGSELMSRLRASFDHVTAAFDAAIARLEACPAPTFDAPAAGAEPTWAAQAAAAPAAPPGPEPTAPTAAVPTAPVEPPAGLPAAGGLGGGMPSLGSATSGLGGLGQQLADMITGLFGGGGSGAGAPDLEPPDLEPPGLEPEDEDLEDDLEDADEDEDLEDTDEDEPAEADDTAVTEPTAEGLDGDPAEDPAEAVADESDSPDEAPVEAPVEPDPAAEVLPPTPPVPPPAEPEALTAEQTPCEIAAEELPSVGG
jgi:uncharacterized protein YukE